MSACYWNELIIIKLHTQTLSLVETIKTSASIVHYHLRATINFLTSSAFETEIMKWIDGVKEDFSCKLAN